MPERPEITVAAGAGGWPPPWDAVAEIEMVLPCEHWSLIGGLMVQLHAVHNRVDAVRPTNGIDLIVHVETVAGRRPATVAAALRGIGYELRPSIDQRQNTAHRFVRDIQVVDVVTSAPAGTVVDVVVADHAAPSTLERLSGHTMVQVDGGTQALRRTVNAVLSIIDDRSTVISVPDVFGALTSNRPLTRPIRVIRTGTSPMRRFSSPVSTRSRRSGRRVVTARGCCISSTTLATRSILRGVGCLQRTVATPRTLSRSSATDTRASWVVSR